MENHVDRTGHYSPFPTPYSLKSSTGREQKLLPDRLFCFPQLKTTKNW